MTTPNQKTTLLMIRHGETIWNAQERFQGYGDSPLTETGRRQADALGRRLQNRPIDLLISSDLGRAQETAGRIANHTKHQVQTERQLRERNYGILEGLRADDIKQRYPEVFARLHSRDPDYIIPEGESLRQHHDRIVACIEDFLILYNGKTAALVVHGGVLDIIFRHVAQLPFSQPRCFATPNMSLNVISNDFGYTNPRWIIESWGDTGHLEGITCQI